MNPTPTRPDLPAVALATEEQLRHRLRRHGKLKGRQPEDAALHEVRECIGERPPEGHRRDLLIEHLHRLNDRFGALREPHLVALSREMNVPMAEVFEVASFYHHFEIVPGDAAVPALTVRVCDGLACEMAGAQGLIERLPALLGKDVRVVAAPCIGRCEQAPAVAVGQAAVPVATPEKVAAAARGGAVEPAPVSIGYDAYRKAGGYALPAALASGRLDAESVLRAMEDSGLRGLGGAGFPAGRKWRIVREQAAPRLFAVNIDEGEPGTFKDRFYLERDPHRFLEGLLVAAQVVGTEAVGELQ
jgi:formate dehydrogenase beta subunit